MKTGEFFYTHRMKNLSFAIVTVCLAGCLSETNEASVEAPKNDTADTVVVVAKDLLRDYPIPVLDSLYALFENSGAVGYAPSEIFHNPSDSGIFVYYTFFNKKYQADRPGFRQMATLITHTYMKPVYGWAKTDKDQTFILLNMNDNLGGIGKSIRIGATLAELKTELGEPIYREDSTHVFLGKNKVVGQFNFRNGLVQTFTYVRLNLDDDIFAMDSIARKEIIEDKLKKAKDF